MIMSDSAADHMWEAGDGTVQSWVVFGVMEFSL